MDKLVQSILIEIQRRMDILWDRLPDGNDVLAGKATTEQLCDTAAYKELEQLESFINNLLSNRQSVYRKFYYGTTKEGWENIKKNKQLEQTTPEKICLFKDKSNVHGDYILEVRIDSPDSDDDYLSKCKSFNVRTAIPLDDIDCIMSPELRMISDNLPGVFSVGVNDYYLQLYECSGIFDGYFCARYADDNGNVPQVHTDGFVEFLCCMSKDRRFIIDDMKRRLMCS